MEPVWRQWVARWPTPAALAEDAPGEAVRAWGRLGYPRRALRLHAAATAIAVDHAGAVPEDLALLRALPGVGAYTAAAVAATKLPFISANANADQSAYTSLQKKSAELVSKQKNIAQFLDRDTRPDFASTVIIPAFQSFLKNPNDIDGLTKSLEEQKKSIFTG